MKKHFFASYLYCIIFTLFSGACSFIKKQAPISLHLKVEKGYEQTFKKDFLLKEMEREHLFINMDSIKQKCFDIILTIENTTSKPVSIWLMTCSWQDNILVSNDHVSVMRQDCDKNFPKLVTLNPSERRIYKTTLVKSIKAGYGYPNCLYPGPLTTKLGLITIGDIYKNSLTASDYNLAMTDKSKWKMIWSNSLLLF